MEERIAKLEKALAFCEHSCEELQEALNNQQERIDELEKRLAAVQSKVSEEPMVRPQEEEEPPPHY